MSRRVCRFVLLALITALIPVTAAAQTRRAVRQATYPWNIGVTAGVTLSKLDTNDDINLDSVWGAVGGLFANKKFDHNFGVQIEALASQRGAKVKNGPTLRITYIDIPVLLRFGSTTTNRTHFHVFAGLTPGFRVKDDLSDGATRLTSDIPGETKGFDLGLPVGLAIENGPWGFDARYTLGLIDVNDGGAPLKNRSAMFKVSYRLN